MIARVLEVEVMDTAEEASDYDAMDHAEVNARFCADLLAVGVPTATDRPRRVLDVGTGTARIPIELCTRAADVEVLGIDLADHMLAVARENVARARLAGRVRLERVDAKALPFADGAFDAVVSNSIVHHIPEPAPALAEMWRVTARGGLLFVRDLLRPESDAEVERLVAHHAGAPAPGMSEASFARQRAMLDASLRAALTVDEVAAMVAPLGVPREAVRVTSDRHWTLSWPKR